MLQANVARFTAKIRYNQALPHTLGKHAEKLALLCTNLMYLRLDERTAPIGGMTDHFALALSARCRQLRFLELAFKRYSRWGKLCCAFCPRMVYSGATAGGETFVMLSALAWLSQALLPVGKALLCFLPSHGLLRRYCRWGNLCHAFCPRMVKSGATLGGDSFVVLSALAWFRSIAAHGLDLLRCTNLMYLRLDEPIAPIRGTRGPFALPQFGQCCQLQFLKLAFKRYSRWQL